MCIGGRPPMPKPQPPAPAMKSADPAPEYVSPEDIKGKETGDDDKLTTKKKKALEIAAAKKGVKEFSAIDPTASTNIPDSPVGGTNI